MENQETSAAKSPADDQSAANAISTGENPGEEKEKS